MEKKASADTLASEGAKGRSLATASTIAQGGKLFEAGGVEVSSMEEGRVLALVGAVEGASRRRVEFTLVEGNFAWRCSCSKKLDRFCKHAVAVALAIEGKTTARPVGLTKTGGFQVGLRRTYDTSPERAWALLVSARGNELLTGRKKALGAEASLRRWEGGSIFYELTTLVPGSHLRMKWRLIGSPGEAWKNESIVQVRILPMKAGRTTIALHQEGLADSGQRQEMLARWRSLHEGLTRLLQAEK